MGTGGGFGALLLPEPSPSTPGGGFVSVEGGFVVGEVSALFFALVGGGFVVGGALPVDIDSKNESKVSAYLARFCSGVSSSFGPVRLLDFCPSQAFKRADFASSVRSCKSGGTNAALPGSSYLKSSNSNWPLGFSVLETARRETSAFP